MSVIGELRKRIGYDILPVPDQGALFAKDADPNILTTVVVPPPTAPTSSTVLGWNQITGLPEWVEAEGTLVVQGEVNLLFDKVIFEPGPANLTDTVVETPYLIVNKSEIVSINGVEQLRGVDYTVRGDNLAVIIDGDLTLGDIVNVHYSYIRVATSSSSSGVSSSSSGYQPVTPVTPWADAYSLRLNGIDEYISGGNIHNFEYSTPFSFSMWVKLESVNATAFMGKGNSAVGGYAAWVNGTEVSFFLYGNNSTQLGVTTSGASIAADGWHHYVFTYDGTSTPGGMKVYIDGSEQSYGSTTNTLDDSILSTQPLLLGLRNASVYMDGHVDEVAVYGVELSAGQAAQLYNSGCPVNASLFPSFNSCLSYWFIGDYETGGVLTDRKNSNNGVAVSVSGFTKDVPCPVPSSSSSVPVSSSSSIPVSSSSSQLASSSSSGPAPSSSSSVPLSSSSSQPASSSSSSQPASSSSSSQPASSSSSSQPVSSSSSLSSSSGIAPSSSSSSSSSPVPEGNLLLWLDASDYNTVIVSSETSSSSSGAGLPGLPVEYVTMWQDKSGNDNDAVAVTGAERPEYQRDMFNGNNAIRFDGVTSSLSIPGMTNPSGNYTIFVVMDSTYSDGETRILFETQTGVLSLYQNRTESSGDYAGFYDGAVRAATPSKYGKQYLRYTLNGTTSQLFRDGGQIGVDLGYTQRAVGGNVAIGSNAARDNYFFYGDIAEILIYDEVLTDPEIAAVESYLENKWLPAPNETALAGFDSDIVSVHNFEGDLESPLSHTLSGTGSYSFPSNYPVSARMGGYIEAGDDSTLVSTDSDYRFVDAFTVSFWFRRPSLDPAGKQQSLVTIADHSSAPVTFNEKFHVRLNDLVPGAFAPSDLGDATSTMLISLRDSTGSIQIPQGGKMYLLNIKEDEWYHFALTFDKTRSTQWGYFNGTKWWEIPWPAPLGLQDNANMELNVLGENWVGSSTFYDGLMDQLTFWDSALSDDAIRAIYNNGSGTLLPTTADAPDMSVQLSGVLSKVNMGRPAGDIMNLPSLGDFSLTAWVRENRDSNFGTSSGVNSSAIIAYHWNFPFYEGWTFLVQHDKYGERTLRMVIRYTTTTMVYDSEVIDNLVGSVPFDEWTFVSMAFDQSTKTCKLYVNGIEVGYQTTTAGSGTYKPANSSTDGRLLIGQDNRSGEEEYRGNISNVAVWTTKLDSSDMTELYNSGTPTDLTQATAAAFLRNWWKLGEDEDDVRIVQDSVGTLPGKINAGGLITDKPPQATPPADLISIYAMGAYYDAYGVPACEEDDWWTDKTPALKLDVRNLTAPVSSAIVWVNKVDGTLGQYMFLTSYRGDAWPECSNNEAPPSLADATSRRYTSPSNGAWTPLDVTHAVNAARPGFGNGFATVSLTNSSAPTAIRYATTRHPTTGIRPYVTYTLDQEGSSSSSSVYTPSTKAFEFERTGGDTYTAIAAEYRKFEELPSGDFSVSLWMKDATAATSIASTILGHTDPDYTDFGWKLQTLSAGTSARYIRFHMRYSSTNLDFRSDYGFVPLNGWINVVATFNATSRTAKIYVNGQEVTYALQQAGSGTVTSTMRPYLVIGETTDSTERFEGRISDPAIFNAELSSAQVAQVFNNGTPPDLSALPETMAWWPIDDTTTTFYIKDRVGGYHATMDRYMTENDHIVDDAARVYPPVSSSSSSSSSVGSSSSSSVSSSSSSPVSSSSSSSPSVSSSSSVDLGIPSNGLLLWLDAADESTITKDGGDFVSLWEDKSGNGNDASQSNASYKPKWYSTLFNGKPCLDFDGTNDWLDLTGMTNSASDYTVFLVLRNDVTSGTYRYIWDNHTYRLVLAQVGSVSGKVGYSEPSDGWQNVDDAQAGNQYLMYLLEDPVGKLYRNGIQIGTDKDYTKTGVDEEVVIGTSHVMTGSYFNGTLSEIIIYNRALNSSEIAQVESHINEKWFPSSSSSSSSGVQFSSSSAVGSSSSSSFNGYSISFDGVNEYINLSSPADLDDLPNADFTISAWIKDEQTAINNLGTIFGVYLGGTGWSLRTYSDASGDRELFFQAPTTGTFGDAGSGYGTISSEWMHVVAAWDSATKTATLYLNGVEPSYRTQTPGTGSYISDASLNKWLGSLPHTGGTQWFKGNLDQISIWNKELSQAEVTEVLNSGLPGDLTQHSAYANLVAWWKMGEGDSIPNVYDSEGSNDGTASNMDSGNIVADPAIVNLPSSSSSSSGS